MRQASKNSDRCHKKGEKYSIVALHNGNRQVKLVHKGAWPLMIIHIACISKYKVIKYLRVHRGDFIPAPDFGVAPYNRPPFQPSVAITVSFLFE